MALTFPQQLQDKKPTARLEVRNLSVNYQADGTYVRAVEDLSFSLGSRETIGIVGESGCGKTTAVLATMRLLPEAGRIVHGQVLLDNVDLLQLNSSEIEKVRWRKISMVFQGSMCALNPTRTIGSQIEEALVVHGLVPKAGRKSEVGQLLDMVGIPRSRAGQYPHQYSGGMRQRAMIAMALICRPDVIIADEPTTALDVIIQAQVMEVLEAVQKETGVSIILVTHDLGLVAELCDRVLVMYAGRMVESATVDAIFNHPSHPYTRRLLEAFPDIHNPKAELISIPGAPPSLRNPPPGCPFRPRCRESVMKCATEMPGIVEVEPDHLVRCLLWEEKQL